jgi:hypothetical protein
VPLPLAVRARRLVEDIDQFLREARDCGYDQARMLDPLVEVSFAAMGLGLRPLPRLEEGRDALEREAAVLRRAAEAMAAGGVVGCDGPAADGSSAFVLAGVRVERLTPKEMLLLACLWAGGKFPRVPEWKALEQVYGDRSYGKEGALETHKKNLAKKLADAKCRCTVRTKKGADDALYYFIEPDGG